MSLGTSSIGAKSSRTLPVGYGAVRVASIGDSIIRGASGVPLAMCIQSGGRARFIRNGGVSGENSTQVLARLPAFIAANPCDMLIIGVGTNDGRQGVTDAVYEANCAAAIQQCRAAGIIPVFLTMPPNNESSANRTAIQTKVRALQRVCSTYGVMLSHRWQASNDGTYTYKAGTNEDTLHPHKYTLWAEGAGLLDDLVAAGYLPRVPNTIVMGAASDPVNKFTNPTLQTDTAGLATGISNLGSFTATMEAGTLGRRQVATKAANATLCGFQFASLAVTSGKRYRFACLCSLQVTSGTALLQTNNDKSVELAMKFVDNTIPVNNGDTKTFWYDDTFTASSTGNATVSIYDNSSGASFVLKCEQVQFYDLTANPEMG